MKILVADDSRSSLMLVSHILESWGYEVVTAADGLVALRHLLQEQDIRLGILDWEMPGMSGPNICQAIQKSPHFVYLMLLTARSHQDDVAHAFEKGASDFLRKPFQPAELKARIASAERLLNMQAQMAGMQKLESIGRLASGIAHEINTPTQFVSDNTHFLRESFDELSGVMDILARLPERLKKQVNPIPELIELGKQLDEVDLDYLCSEIPLALEQSAEGLERIGAIVSSMKAFSHPDTETKQPVDIQRAITDTINVARNEWKYAAELETDFDPELQELVCFQGELNQVVLALVVNAAQAIREDRRKQGREGELGRIKVSTRDLGDSAEIRVADDGPGIPEEIRAKIFEPFFTTKDVGVGTGQGLAIAHSAIAERHGGTLTVETEVGEGATFVIRLPRG